MSKYNWLPNVIRFGNFIYIVSLLLQSVPWYIVIVLSSCVCVFVVDLSHCVQKNNFGDFNARMWQLVLIGSIFISSET